MPIPTYYHRVSYKTGEGLTVETFTQIPLAEVGEVALELFSADPDDFIPVKKDNEIIMVSKRLLKTAKVVPMLDYEGFTVEAWGNTRQEAASLAKQGMIKALKNISKLQVMGLEVLQQL